MADVAVVGGFGRLGAAQEVADLAVDVELVAAWGGFVGCGCVLVDGWVYGGRFDVYVVGFGRWACSLYGRGRFGGRGVGINIDCFLGEEVKEERKEETLAARYTMYLP